MVDKCFAALYQKLVRSLIPEPGHKNHLLHRLLRLLQTDRPGSDASNQNRQE